MKLLVGVLGAASMDFFVDKKGNKSPSPKAFRKAIDYLYSDDVVYQLAVVLDTAGEQIGAFPYTCIASFLQKADKERSGVISTAQSTPQCYCASCCYAKP
jgi:Type IV secretory pathway, VirD4 components